MPTDKKLTDESLPEEQIPDKVKKVIAIAKAVQEQVSTEQRELAFKAAVQVTFGDPINW